MVMVMSLNANAIELFSTKKSGSGLNVLTLESFNKAWSTVPTCIKQKSRVIGVNGAYMKAFGKTNDYCSASESAKRQAQLNGIKEEVVIVRTAELPESVYQELKKQGKLN